MPPPLPWKCPHTSQKSPVGCAAKPPPPIYCECVQLTIDAHSPTGRTRPGSGGVEGPPDVGNVFLATGFLYYKKDGMSPDLSEHQRRSIKIGEPVLSQSTFLTAKRSKCESSRLLHPRLLRPAPRSLSSEEQTFPGDSEDVAASCFSWSGLRIRAQFPTLSLRNHETDLYCNPCGYDTIRPYRSGVRDGLRRLAWSDRSNHIVVCVCVCMNAKCRLLHLRSSKN